MPLSFQVSYKASSRQQRQSKLQPRGKGEQQQCTSLEMIASSGTCGDGADTGGGGSKDSLKEQSACLDLGRTLSPEEQIMLPVLPTAVVQAVGACNQASALSLSIEDLVHKDTHDNDDDDDDEDDQR